MDRNFQRVIYPVLRRVIKEGSTCRRFRLLPHPLNKHRTLMIWQKQDMYGLAGWSGRRWDLPSVWIPLGTSSLKKPQTSCFHIIWNNLQVKWMVLDHLSQFNMKIKAITEEWVLSDCKIFSLPISVSFWKDSSSFDCASPNDTLPIYLRKIKLLWFDVAKYCSRAMSCWGGRKEEKKESFYLTLKSTSIYKFYPFLNKFKYVNFPKVWNCKNSTAIIHMI